jgi:hypothetical protein
MKLVWPLAVLMIGFVMFPSSLSAQDDIKQFIFFNRDRDRITEKSFLETEGFAGAQLKYTWKELESSEDKYDFESIQKDLDFLTANKKRLFIQIQDVTFGESCSNVPDYLLKNPRYSGGISQQYLLGKKDKIIKKDGCVARRWDKNVAERFGLLIKALGMRFDGKIEGINLPETAVEFGETGKLYPKGFSPKGYRDAIEHQMRVLKGAFPNSVALQYANFMPGEWLPFEDKGYLESLFKTAAKYDIAMGGPDIKIYKKAQMNHSYKFLKRYSGKIKTGVAVQWGNYEEITPKPGRRVTVKEIYCFAKDEIGLDYIFWSTQEPFYSRDVIPFARNSERKPVR